MPLNRPTILMCPPDFFGIEYEINPWMSRSRASDAALARQQWQALHDLLVSLGVGVRLMQPVAGLPDLVFTANAGLMWGDRVFLSRFRHAARQGETPVDEAWFAANGFWCVTLPADVAGGRSRSVRGSGAREEGAGDRGRGDAGEKGEGSAAREEGAGEKSDDSPAPRRSHAPAPSQSHITPPSATTAGLHFEGAGDALFCGETLYGGYIIRSDARALQWVAAEMACRVIPLQLVDPHYYHLDTCFCPLSPTEAIWYPPAFDEYGQKAVRQHVERLIDVEPDEAARFACNAVVVRSQLSVVSGGAETDAAAARTWDARTTDYGPRTTDHSSHVVLNTGCPRLEAALAERGYTPHATPLDEFIKAGGSAKCLTLRLDGEDAAVWAAGG